MYVQDFDGNNQLDVACSYEDGLKHIHNLGLQQASVITVGRWCHGLSEVALVGHFMNRKTTDMMCYNWELGDTHFPYLGSDGSINKKTIELPSGWCMASDWNSLKTGDFNGDSFTDLLCHNQNGVMKILIHLEVKKGEATWFGHEFHTETDFCSEIGAELKVYDANGDGYDDLTCHTPEGVVTISESHLVEERRNTALQSWIYDRTLDITPDITPEMTPEITPELTPEMTTQMTPDITPYLYYSFDNGDRMDLYSGIDGIPPSFRQRDPTTYVILWQGTYIELEGESGACMIQPETCDNGGTMAFWVGVGYDEFNLFSSADEYGTTGLLVTIEPAGNIYIGVYKRESSLSWTANMGVSWIHVTIVYQKPPNPMIMYANGVEGAQPTEYAEVTVRSLGGSEMSIGRSEFYQVQRNGAARLDELKFWNRALSPDEVQAVYNEAPRAVNDDVI